MKKEIISIEDKTKELIKYRDLIIASIDYYMDTQVIKIKTSDFDSDEHFKLLKMQTIENFQKGRLSKLKQWFHSLSEMPRETYDFKFNAYLISKTGYYIDIFKDYYNRVEKIVDKGKITSDNQFYDINSMVDQLCQTIPVDTDKINILNKLLIEYELRKTKKK